MGSGREGLVKLIELLHAKCCVFMINVFFILELPASIDAIVYHKKVHEVDI